MSQPKICPTIDEAWCRCEPIRLSLSATEGVVDAYVVMDSESGPLRLDLVRSGAESYAFEDALCWSSFVVVGRGHGVYLVDRQTREVSVIDLGAYFGRFYPLDSELLVTSAERVFLIQQDGALGWTSEVLAVDGVVIDSVQDGVIHGLGEWDPPGGWRRFALSLDAGQRDPDPKPITPPAWHAAVLEQRAEEAARNPNAFEDWDEAKRAIRECIQGLDGPLPRQDTDS
jgi:hypothetical protein